MKNVTRKKKQDRESSKEERKNNVKKNKKRKGRIGKDKDKEPRLIADYYYRSASFYFKNFVFK
uniref:Uncharacterized protein n=1 Tax=Romanomermis culicivorax TaxID=13658 RepID=A0A915HHJ3_ROMCU